MSDVIDIHDDDALAGEYVLGLLARDELRAAEARLGTDRSFAAEVAAWWDRLAPLLEALPGVAPSASLWARIDAALDRSSVTAPPQAQPEPAEAVQSAARRDRRPDASRRRRGGAGGLIAAALAGALAAGVAAVGVVAYRDRSAVEAPVGGVLVATLSPEAGESLFVATIDPARRTIVVASTRVLPADDRARELWLIPADGVPRSAGLLAAETGSLPLGGELLQLATAGAALAVSLEPAGGSTTGAPTGPVVASGALVAVG